MPLSAGTRFGPYQIVAPLGAGGMGEVYRATDTGLHRDVAIKVLPASFSADADRVARFRREAQLLASLNHTSIAAVYGLEEAAGSIALVMELVDGDDLAERLSQGAVPIADAIALAAQLVDALEAAHEAGIVHRDLKPANIKVRPDGTLKVLDFGLAKALGGDGSTATANAMHSPTLTARATEHGLILGTAAYMAPEQARGKPVDKRADIWAFGVVLFEMLSGTRLFPGETMTDTLAAVLTREPAWDLLPAATPAGVRRLLARCLEREPKKRLRDIGDARLDLQTGGAPVETHAAAPPAPRNGIVARALPWAVAALLAVALAMSLARPRGVAPAGTPLRRFTLALPSKSAPNWNDFGVAISPDGAHIAYNCREGNTVSLCMRALDSLDARRVADGRDAADWFFSPDGEWIGIADDVGFSKVSIRGGQPQRIYRWPGTEPQPTGFSWGPDGYILFGTASGLVRVADSGGSPETVTRIAAGSGVTAHLQPSHLPGGRSALITIVHADGSETGGLVDVATGTVRDLGVRGHSFFHVAPGWLAFQQGTTLLAAAFDPANPTRAANPVPVIEHVGRVSGVARDGTLAYVPPRGESSARLVWVDRDGRPTAVPAEPLDYTHLDLAPDGRRALLNLAGGFVDVIDLQSGTRKLVAQGGFPIWSSNGDRVTFTGKRGLEWAPADGSAPAEVLVPGGDGYVVPTSWNATTGELAYYDHRAFEIWIRSPNGQTRRFLGGPGRKRSGRFSPDGKWMAFVSDETGDYQVYVTAYPGPGPTVAVSTKGGLSPIWSADGHELFFRLGSKVMVARMASAPPLGFNPPVELFDGPYTLDLLGHQREDIASDGRRFLMVENSDDFPIVIVQNWPLELARLVR